MTTLDSRFRGNDMFLNVMVMITQNLSFLSANFGYEVSHSSKLDSLPSDHNFYGDNNFCDGIITTDDYLELLFLL